MKFDKLVVVGNPPYQEMDGGHAASAKPLYNVFIETIIDHLAPDFFTFIVPSRWMIGGKGLDDFRERLMSDRRMKSVTHFQRSEDVFSTVSLTGGVNYFLWEREYWGPCYFTVGEKAALRFLDERDIVLLDLNANSILTKVLEHSKGSWVSEHVHARNPFGLRTNFIDWKEEGTPCYARGKELHYCDPGAFVDRDNILSQWKVCTPYAYGDYNNAVRSVIPYTLLLPPGTICTETYLVLRSFETEHDAQAFDAFVKTKFFRFLLSLRVLTQHRNTQSFSWIPDMVGLTDPELYDTFGLNEDERSYIEGKIR